MEYYFYIFKFNFKNKECSFFPIKVYFNRINYYKSGRGKNQNSAEIIFFDFLSHDINNKDCSIVYDKTRLIPSENFEFMTRKRINFINIDIKKLSIPNSINNEKINIEKIIKNNNFQIFIINVILKIKQ